MGDYLDKETKQFMLIFVGISIFLLFIYPRISDNLMTMDFTNQLNPILTTQTTNQTKSVVTIDQSKDYYAHVNTSIGSFKINLFEKDAPKNVSNFISNFPLYRQAKIVAQKDFLFKIDVNKEPNTKVEDEINADYLLLDRIKIKDAKFIHDLYDPSDSSSQIFSPSNISKYEDFTLKEFYSEILGYTYKPDLITTKATKYVVYMTNNGANQNNIDFFVLMTSNAPQVDGRYTPIGQVTEGFEILDLLNVSGTSATVKSIVIEEK